MLLLMFGCLSSYEPEEPFFIDPALYEPIIEAPFQNDSEPVQDYSVPYEGPKIIWFNL